MKNLNKIENFVMQPEDTFEFGCGACGGCCRNQDEKDNMVSGMDIFRIAKTMGCTTEEVIKKYMTVGVGNGTKLPVVYLRVRDDKSCIFLRKGKCMVHDTKPIKCAIFPLGRAIADDGNKQSMMYFKSGYKCKCGVKKESQTLQEWLNEMHVSELDSMSYAWNKLMKTALRVMNGVYDDELFLATLFELYINFDITQPYEVQVNKNIETLNSVFVLKKKCPKHESLTSYIEKNYLSGGCLNN